MPSELIRSQKRQILSDTAYMKQLEYSNSQSEKAEWQLLEARGDGELLFNGYRFQFYKLKGVLKMDGDDAGIINVFDISDLYT